MFNQKCAKPFYEIEKLPNKKQPLKSLLKNVKAKYNKKNGISRPYVSAIAHAEKILGQPIFEHELIRGHEKSINRLKECKNMNDILNVLQRRHRQIYGYDKIWGTRYLFIKYGESDREFNATIG